MTQPPSSRLEPKVEKAEYGPWTFTTLKGFILKSDGSQRQQFENELRLPQLPEMIFPDNTLHIDHKSGFGLKFNALDALKQVDPEHSSVEVAATQAWKAARSDCEHISTVVKPFDWTFTTDYKGTFFGNDTQELRICPTEEKINVEKLQQKENILFYTDLLLYEDELSDSGTSLISVKMRVMPSCFLVLLRFFMRVDDVIVRLNDTRIYHEMNKHYFIREYTSRENNVSELKVPPHLLRDPAELSEHLTVRSHILEKLEFPPEKA